MIYHMIMQGMDVEGDEVDMVRQEEKSSQEKGSPQNKEKPKKELVLMMVAWPMQNIKCPEFILVKTK